jgi:hypothetical protein
MGIGRRDFGGQTLKLTTSSFRLSMVSRAMTTRPTESPTLRAVARRISIDPLGEPRSQNGVQPRTGCWAQLIAPKHSAKVSLMQRAH